MAAFSAPPATGTIHAILRRHAEEGPDRPALSFLRDGGDDGAEVLTYGELLRQAEDLAGRLRKLRGERVMLLHPPGREFVVAFFACLVAGVTAVPLHPPTTRRLQERLQRIVADCSPSLLLTTAAAQPRLAAISDATGLPVLVDAAADPDGEPIDGPPVDDRTPAFLQYTSGSTGDPKGVMVTHGNLVCDSMAIAAGFGTQRDDVGVSWLPLHHDMGLVGSVADVLLRGMHWAHMTPEAMVRKPLRWLRAISTYRATISGGPDFAWRLLADRVTPSDLVGLDLSCWRVAYSGAEPVRPDTLRRVAALLAPAGFRAESFLPCYGLAEATLMVSAGPAGRLPLMVPSPEDGIERVACGRPVPEEAVAIVDPERGIRMPEGRTGEVWVSGGHVAAGYWGRPTLSEAVFGARLAGDPRRWLRTGDLGFIADRQLCIAGRIKDLLIVNGRKFHPEDIETTVQTKVAACTGGSCAAFQTDTDQRLGLAIELARIPDDDTARADIAACVRQAVWSEHGIQPDLVLFERVGRLPRTTSGKVRRSACADRLRDGGWSAAGVPA